MIQTSHFPSVLLKNSWNAVNWSARIKFSPRKHFKENSLSAGQFIFGLLNKSLSFTIFYIKKSAIPETLPKILQVVFNLVFGSSWWQLHIQFYTIGTKGINNLKVVDVKKVLLYCRHYQLWSDHFKFKTETEKQLLSAQASKRKSSSYFLVWQKFTAALSNRRFCMAAKFSSCNILPHWRELCSNRYSRRSQIFRWQIPPLHWLGNTHRISLTHLNPQQQ